MNPEIAITLVYTLAGVGGWTVVFFLARAGFEWLDAKKKINRVVPELSEAVRALKLKVEFLESDVKRLERCSLRRPLLDEPEATTSAAAPGDATSREAISAGA